VCGRAVVIDKNGIERVGLEFSAPFSPAMWKPRYNVRPTEQLPILRLFDGQARIDQVRWGLIPFWSKESAPKFPTFNARADGVHEKPTYREPFRKRRCLVLVDGFYEWPKKPSKDRNPRFIRMQDGATMTIAGLWDQWTDPETGEVIESCTIITTDANEVLASVPHDRMPVILEGEARHVWLDPRSDAEALRTLLIPRRAEGMQIQLANGRLVNYGVDEPGCIEAEELDLL